MEVRLSKPQTIVKVNCTLLSQYQYCWLYVGIFSASCTWMHMVAGSSCSGRPIAEINNSKIHLKRNTTIIGKFLLTVNAQRKPVYRSESDAERQ
jgi:hypothetical protein